MNMILKLLIFSLLFGCTKDNKTGERPEITELRDRKALYCELSESLYNQWEKTLDPKCDAALFTALHGLACGYVSVTQFESEDEPGKLCRRPGCSCYDNWAEGQPGSDSGFSKDMATGLQLFLATRPNPGLAERIVEYGKAEKWVVCSADTAAAKAGKCLMSLNIIKRWGKIAELPVDPSQGSSLIPTEFAAHLQILSALVDNQVYGGISDSSLGAIKAQAEREPNNLLFQAASSRFTGKPSPFWVAKRLIEKFPAEGLPTTDDYCTPYLYQRDEMRDGKVNPDWLPCPGKKTHSGTDFLLAAWVILDL